MPSNITYVSYIIYSPDDRVSVEQRIGWMKPLLALNIQLLLFADETYTRLLPALGPNVHVLPLDITTLETYKRIHAVKPIHLPPNRNTVKDTLNFITLMNCKPEIIQLAVPYVSTPYMAYIDAGLSKITSSPSVLQRLETLQVHNIPLILLPGCKPIQQVETFPFLWDGIHWMLSGGFFILPTERADEFLAIHLKALQGFLAMHAITWEVNVWASFAHEHADRIVWYYGDHDDRMILSIPASCIVE
jgi:hypothetical protein